MAKNIEMQVLGANGEYEQIYPVPARHASSHSKEGSDPINLTDIGAMDKNIYDSQNRNIDIFTYVDEHATNIPITSTPSKTDTIWIDPSEDGDSNYYSIEETNALLINKADATNVYTKSETDSVLSSKPNPNLLDNWYFGNPVDQRGGYVVPPGEGYYIIGTGTQVGTTDSYYKVLRILDGDYPVINVGGTEYVTPPGTYVRGYIGDGYSNYVLDRWRVENNIVVTFESDGVSLENVGDSAGQYNQELQHDFFPEGTLLCISAIVKSASGDARLFLSQSDSPFGHSVEFIPLLQPGLYSGFGNLLSGNHKFSIYLGAGAKIKLAAAKLELGSQQTLAHQDTNGNWVLNEIPDYGEQLARCQRYFVNFNPYKMAWFAMPPAVASNASQAYSAVTLPVAMRAQPVVSYGGNIALSQEGDHAVTAILVSDNTFTGNSVQLRYDVSAGNLTANSLYRVQGYRDPTSYIWLSADL